MTSSTADFWMKPIATVLNAEQGWNWTVQFLCVGPEGK